MLEKAPVSHTQYVENSMQTAPNVPTNSDSYSKHSSHKDISSNARKVHSLTNYILFCFCFNIKNPTFYYSPSTEIKT